MVDLALMCCAALLTVVIGACLFTVSRRAQAICGITKKKVVCVGEMSVESYIYAEIIEILTINEIRL